MTTIKPIKSAEKSAIDENSVVEYLQDHSDLLERHPEVLSSLTFAHESGAAVSLVERQLKVLREENRELKDKLAELVHIARENEELSQRFHRLSLELMSVNNLHDIIAMIRDQIQTFFYTDYVNFYFSDQLADRLNGLEKNILDPNSKHASKIRGWMQAREPVFGPLDPGVRNLLFGQTLQVPSSVLVPLYHTDDIGLLALGSKSKDRYHHAMGTLFLTQLGDLVSSKLKHFVG